MDFPIILKEANKCSMVHFPIILTKVGGRSIQIDLKEFKNGPRFGVKRFLIPDGYNGWPTEKKELRLNLEQFEEFLAELSEHQKKTIDHLTEISCNFEE